MKIGDRVTGVPANEMRRKENPTVTGVYDTQAWTFLGKKYTTEYVRCGDIEIDCTDIRPAGRREKDTVLES